MNTINEKIILGIDPGTNIMGYALISVREKNITLIAAGILNLSKIEDHMLKLKTIFDKVTTLIENYKADELAIEAPFFGKNVQSMLKLGRAQGVAIAAALNRQLPVYEYSPRKIKQSVTGKGGASKEQVAAMLQNLIGFENQPKYLDATDALAAAVCHSFQNKPTSGKSKNYSGWKSFVSDNPDKLLK